MSTRCTIGYGDGYHIYEECFDRNKVWIELDDKTTEIELEYSSHVGGSVVVGIDVTIWRSIVEAWSRSHWGRNIDLDHSEPKIDLEYLQELVESAKKKKEKKNEE